MTFEKFGYQFCHDSPEKCVPAGMTGEDAELRRKRTRQVSAYTV